MHSVGDYTYYVTHPNMMDADLQHAHQQATIVAAVTLTVATGGMTGVMTSGAAGMNFGLASGAAGAVIGLSQAWVYGGDLGMGIFMEHKSLPSVRILPCLGAHYCVARAGLVHQK